MNNITESFVFAVQSAFVELLELTQKAAEGDSSEKQEILRSETQKTMLMFIAATVVANPDYSPAKQQFISLLIDCSEKPGGAVRYLNEYAAEWVAASRKVPQFFEAAINYDSSHGTEIARAMLQEIQRIGVNVYSSDERISMAERETVRLYLKFLEDASDVPKPEIEVRIPACHEDPEPERVANFQPQAHENRVVSIPFTANRRRAELCWVAANESINIAGFQIPSGMIYVSDGQSSTAEASTINIRLPVGNATSGSCSRLSYYPQYLWLTPDQRAAYLEWLASGRVDGNPEARELGYVFLFFYGLERRLLVDTAPDQEVVAEVVRLLQHYGPYTRSRSLQSYTSQLIHFWGWRQGADYYSQLLEWMKTLPVTLLGEDELAIVLASQCQANKPLQPDLAYEVASRNYDARRSVIISRVNDEFRSLFSKRYLEQFPSGMNLTQAKQPARLAYRAASPSLLQQSSGGFSIQIPDVLGIQRQFSPLVKIWNSCVEDLAGYSRARTKSNDLSAPLKAYLALPDELRIGTVHPLTKQWNEMLQSARNSNGYAIVDVGRLAQLHGFNQREKLTVGQSRDLAGTLESLQYAVEPDARFDGAYSWDQELAVFKQPSDNFAAPSKNYVGASVLLKLCVLVAGADGHVAPEELDVSRHFIEKNLALSSEDHQRLEALEQVLIADPSRFSGALTKIAKPIPAAQRELIGEVLVYVAAADKVVTKDEIKTLEKIFKAFELPVNKLETYLKAVGPEFAEVTIQTAGNVVSGERIPRPDQPFQIDMARVDQIAKETSEVAGLLAKVMVDDDEEQQIKAKEKETAKSASKKPTRLETLAPAATIPDWIKTLEPKYHPIILGLIQSDSMPRSDFDVLVKKSQLMPLNAFDAINDWADDHLGDFLLEGSDPILVHRNLIK
jgi:tellurite resistance protein